MLKRPQKLVALVEGETLTQEDFIQSFEKVIDLVVKLKEYNVEMMKAFEELVQKATIKLKEDNLTESARMKEALASQMQNLFRQFTVKSLDIDAKLSTVRDGKDADETAIIDKVLAQIKLPEQKEVILDGPKEIRDKLEGLRGKERLDMEAIDGLKEILEEIKKMRTAAPRFGGVGPNFNATKVIQGEQLSGSGTSFTLAHNPLNRPAIYALGQRLREGTQFDYTITNRDIVTTLSWSAGDLIADYVKV